MKAHPLCAALAAHIEQAVPGLHAYPYISTGDVVLPYVVISETAEEERIKGNRTWQFAISAELHANAYDTDTDKQRDYFRELCATLGESGLTAALNDAATDFYIYTLALDSIDEPTTSDSTFIQAARLRALIQF